MMRVIETKDHVKHEKIKNEEQNKPLVIFNITVNWLNTLF